MFGSIAKQAGGTGRWLHFRGPVPLDKQPVIRQNRDTLYTFDTPYVLLAARILVDPASADKADVDGVHHLLGSAAGWGGLPDDEAMYINVDPGLPLGEYKIEVGEVPVDAFWSISLYNKEGYFEPNNRNLNSINSITAAKNPDGTITVNFGVSDDEKPNYFPIMEGWNYLVRLYRPRTSVRDGSWTFPVIAPA